jgi:hypothetical protein
VSFKAGRLGPGDWLLFGCSVGLLVDLFVVRWFADRTGWQALSVLGPLTAVVCAVGVVIWWLQATRRSPALPTILVTLLLPVALIAFLLLLYRVLIDTPGDTSARAGGYVGLLLSLGLAAGVYVSLRREGVADADSAPVAEAISVRAAQPRADT